MNFDFQPLTETEDARCVRGSVSRINDDGSIVVWLEIDQGREVICDCIQNGTGFLRRGDSVLVLLSPDMGEMGCVIGKVGPYSKPGSKSLEIAAQEDLTIRCGKGSITIRKSGQILIKGVEIVSHAKQGNRIRGASIKLN